MLIGAFPLVHSPVGLIFQIYVSVQPEFTFKLSIDLSITLGPEIISYDSVKQLTINNIPGYGFYSDIPLR